MTAPVTPPTDPLDAFDDAPAAPVPGTPPLVRQQPQPPVQFPMGWMLDRASYAVRARSLLEFGNLGPDGVASARRIALSHLPSIRLAIGQGKDGTWGGRMLTQPKSDDPEFTGVGTVPAVRRLLEYGWPADATSLWQARRPLFRLLAADDDPAFLYELKTDLPDAALARHGRLRLREAAASALAHLGFEADPRLRGCAARVIERISAWLKQEAPERGPSFTDAAAPPSVDALAMLAYMPIFRTEHAEALGRLSTYLTQPPASGNVKQRFGRVLLTQPRLVIGDPLADVTEPDGRQLPRVLAWLELLARLGILRRHEPWRALLDRLLDARDADGRWTRPVGAAPSDPLTWPGSPLGSPSERGEWQADATFRLALIARLAGHPVVLG